MNRWLISLCIIGFISSDLAYSQQYRIVDNWRDYVADLAAESEDAEQIEALYADLSYLAEHPLDVNRLTHEQLKRLPFLTDNQIEALIAYPQRYGELSTLYELKQIEVLDGTTLSLLLPFVKVGEKSVEKRLFTSGNMLKYGNNELVIKYDQCLQRKSGYQPISDSLSQLYPNRHYLGEPFYHSVRYSYSFDDRLLMGFVAEKDAGEPFAKSIHKGYDYYSAHLFLKDMNRVKSLAIGDYKVSFGQGLVVSHEFSVSKSAQVAQIERRGQGFRRHYSTNEQDFFRGAAATLRFGRWALSGFYSFRKWDAGLDSLTFKAWKRDGLHRLPRDWNKRHTVPVQSYGGNVRWEIPKVQIGLTAIGYSFGRYQLQPAEKPYTRFYLSGSTGFNMSVDYVLKTGGFRFFGETAIDKQRAVATLNALQFTPSSSFTLLASYRNYDKRYQALFGNAFSQGSTVQNEQGWYLGLQLFPSRRWRLSLYGDWFRFPWLKSGIDAPSSGEEYMAQVDYTPSVGFAAYLRYRYREKEKSQLLEGAQQESVLPYKQHRIRYQQVVRLADWQLKTAADGVISQKVSQADSRGILLSQGVAWRPRQLPLRIEGYAGWFHTDDSSSRISTYEQNLLYAFQMPSLHGKGVRLVLTLELELAKQLLLSAKLADTHYADRKRIGSDAEQIDGSHKTDLYALVRWKF